MNHATNPLSSLPEGRTNIWRSAHLRAIAGGSIHGVAKKAKIIAFKENCQGDMDYHTKFQTVWAWRVMIQNVVTKLRHKKAVFVYAGGTRLPYHSINRMLTCMQAYHWESDAFPTNHHVDYQPWGLPMPSAMDFWLPLLREAWQKDIVTVFSAGPKKLLIGPGRTHHRDNLKRGSLLPQRYGRSNNRLITASPADVTGSTSNSEIRPAQMDNGAIIDPNLIGSDDIPTLGAVVNLPDGARGEIPVKRAAGSY